MRRSLLSGWVKQWLVAGGLALPALSCIQREVQLECVPVAGAEEPVEVAATGETKTGNWGKVQGVSVLGPNGVREFELFGEKSRASIEIVPVLGQPFKEALRATINEKSSNLWDVQMFTKTVGKVEAGDVLLASFYMRTEWTPDESGEGRSEFVFELARDPWTKSVSQAVSASRDWKKILVGFEAEETYAPGDAQMIFRLGYDKQKFDIADLKVENFGKKLTLADLPTTGIEYPGMEPDAPWRAAAAERIEKHRKADLSVIVKDGAGKVVPGADVHVVQTGHAFGFGTAVQASRLASDGEFTYKKKVTDYFNWATIENNLKWVALEGDWGPSFTLQQADGAIAWLTQQDLAIRGHVLIWPGWKNLPKSLKAFEKQPAELRKRVNERIRSMAEHTAGKVLHWDVLNEPFDNHDLMDILGKDEMVEWFRIARKADPKAQLYINDYAILSGGGGTTPHRDHYEETIAFLVSRNTPFDGIGFQGHFGSSLTGPEDLLKLLDRYAKFGKRLTVTEFDVVIDDAEIAGRYTRDFYTTLFSHPAVDGVVMWGFWDRSHWKKNAVMFDNDWGLKPGGQAYVDLVQREWHTDERGKSDDTGTFQTRGFHGDYTLEVSAGGKTKKVETKLIEGSAPVVVTLD